MGVLAIGIPFWNVLAPHFTTLGLDAKPAGEAAAEKSDNSQIFLSNPMKKLRIQTNIR
jgi:hypothetical protein